ncbi:MAG: GNAT family N-acetyltransferase [Burkholderiales bacterium]
MVVIRPLGRQDAQAFVAFVAGLSERARYERFQCVVKEISPSLLQLLVDPEPPAHVALAAFAGDQLVGEARYASHDAGTEFAIAVADDWRRLGVGHRLLQALLARARIDGVARLDGEVLAWNQAMLGFVEQHGFRVRAHPGDARLIRVELAL